jgi:hypothetical protein
VKGCSWVPGDGWGVVTERFAGWLPPTTPHATVLAVAGAAGATDALAVLAGGAEAWAVLVPGTPLVVRHERVAVESLDAEGRTVKPAAAATLRLGAPPAPGVAALPLVDGVVACGALLWRNPEAAPAGLPGTAVKVTAGSARGAGEAGSGHPAGHHAAAAAPVLGVPSAPGVVPSPAIVLAPTEVPGLITEVPWAAGDAAAPNPFAELWGHTMRRPVEAAAVREVRNADLELETNPLPSVPAAPTSPATPAPVPAAVGQGAASTAPPAVPPGSPAVASPVPPPDAVAEPARPVVPGQPRSTTATLVASLLDEEEPVADDHGEVVTADGARMPLTGALVIGRAPQPVPGLECRLLRVTSPERTVSRSHVLITGEHGVVRLKDLGSNNGTMLLRHGQRLPVGSDAWTGAADGDVVDLGDGVTVLLVGLP